ncbi:MAG: hypothetical protein QXH91_05540 [Candidatus Bathyarchaeia archaeon]
MRKLKKSRKNAFLAETRRSEMAKSEQAIIKVESKIVLKNENFPVKMETPEKQIKLYSIALDQHS